MGRPTINKKAKIKIIELAEVLLSTPGGDVWFQSLEYLKVHQKGRSEADVTEGSGGIWERLHYDWSAPDRVVLTTIDSNVWGGASGHTHNFTRRPDGTTDIDVVVVRDGKNLKGRILGLVLGTVGRRVLERAFANSVKAIEARNSASASPDSAACWLDGCTA